MKVDELAVKGKSVGIRIYTVLDVPCSKAVEYDDARELHNKMHELYKDQKFDKAIKMCKDLKGKYPKGAFDGQMDKYYDMWIERCEYMLTQDLPKDWNGVFIATTK